VDWQLPVVVFLVSCAVLYLGRQAWRTFAGRKGSCGGGCGCASIKAAPSETGSGDVLISPADIGLRRKQPGPL